MTFQPASEPSLTRRVVGLIVGSWLLLACGIAPTLIAGPPDGTSTGPTGPTQLAHVTQITDGDTIHVDISGTDYRLRYIGMDTPESVKPGTPVEPYAKAAAARNAALVADRDVILEQDVSETDRYGRCCGMCGSTTVIRGPWPTWSLSGPATPRS